MKKYLLLLLLLIPFNVFAENFTITYDINAKVELKGKALANEEFTFELRDYKDNVIKTTTNDKDGNIVFKDMIINYELDNNNYPKKIDKEESFYIIRMKDDKIKNYKIDTEPIYVGVRISKDSSTNDYFADVNYLKDLEEFNHKAEKTGKSVYHATPEELQGFAYGEFDPTTGTIRVFRDTPGKYNEGDIVNGKRYCLVDTMSYMHDCNIDGYNNIKKIVFEDAFKLTKPYFFESMNYLEEIEGLDKVDTSELTSARYMFGNAKSLKKLDLSTWDTSNVTDMYYMFYECESLEELYLDNFDTSKVKDMHYMFSFTYNLKKLNLDSFTFDPNPGYGNDYPDLGYIFGGGGATAIESIDLSNATFVPTTGSILSGKYGYAFSSTPNLRYINFPAAVQTYSALYFSNSPKLSVIKTVNRNQLPVTESYTDEDGNVRYKYGMEYAYLANAQYWYFPNSKIVLSGYEYSDYMMEGRISIYNAETDETTYDYNEYDTSVMIRPSMNPGPYSFNVLYEKTSVKGVIEELTKNPNTGVFTYSFLVLLSLIGMSLFYIRVIRKDKFKYNNK